MNRSGIYPEFRSWPAMLQGFLRGADILVCQLGRLSSRPEAGLESPANRQAGKPAPRCFAGDPRYSTSEFRMILTQQAHGCQCTICLLSSRTHLQSSKPIFTSRVGLPLVWPILEYAAAPYPSNSKHLHEKPGSFLLYRLAAGTPD